MKDLSVFLKRGLYPGRMRNSQKKRVVLHAIQFMDRALLAGLKPYSGRTIFLFTALTATRLTGLITWPITMSLKKTKKLKKLSAKCVIVNTVGKE